MFMTQTSGAEVGRHFVHRRPVYIRHDLTIIWLSPNGIFTLTPPAPDEGCREQPARGALGIGSCRTFCSDLA